MTVVVVVVVGAEHGIVSHYSSSFLDRQAGLSSSRYAFTPKVSTIAIYNIGYSTLISRCDLYMKPSQPRSATPMTFKRSFTEPPPRCAVASVPSTNRSCVSIIVQGRHHSEIQIIRALQLLNIAKPNIRPPDDQVEHYYKTSTLKLDTSGTATMIKRRGIEMDHVSCLQEIDSTLLICVAALAHPR